MKHNDTDGQHLWLIKLLTDIGMLKPPCMNNRPGCREPFTHVHKDREFE